MDKVKHQSCGHFQFRGCQQYVLWFWHLDKLAFLGVVLSCNCQALHFMFQVQLMVCCNQYWYLQQLRWFCSKLLLLLKVSYLAFESILVFLCLQGEVGRKHLQGSFCFCSSLKLYPLCSIVSSSLLKSCCSLYFIVSFMYIPTPPPGRSSRFL